MGELECFFLGVFVKFVDLLGCIDFLLLFLVFRVLLLVFDVLWLDLEDCLFFDNFMVVVIFLCFVFVFYCSVSVI